MAGDITDTMLGLGMELLMLGVAAGVASINDEIGNIILIFMVGLFLLWLVHHTTLTGTVPGIFTYLQQKGAVG